MTNLLQPGRGATSGDVYLPAEPGEVSWGLLPNAVSPPVRSVVSGATVCLDTISHEGLLEDQGRDPATFFAAAGIGAVLDDAAELARSGTHDPLVHGPHVVTGPIEVEGALPGDVLEVEILELRRRAPYGVISNRHGKGALPGEMPLAPDGWDPAVPVPPVCTIATVDGGRGAIAVGDGRRLTFPLREFLGIMGVAPATDRPVHSVPPGPHGGNLDVGPLGVGARLFLPVQVPGAMFYAGDPHFAMGDGEVALTAFEAPLRATLRLTLHSDAATRSLAAALAAPYADTGAEHLLLGLDEDLDEAVRKATRSALALLGARYGFPAPIALAYLSAAAHLHVSQVVDIVKGVHFAVPKPTLESL
ncbi:acetamidase [Nonomuraea basaltis]|nr:acetamidase [Nonomuraea basaltis]